MGEWGEPGFEYWVEVIYYCGLTFIKGAYVFRTFKSKTNKKSPLRVNTLHDVGLKYWRLKIS